MGERNQSQQACSLIHQTHFMDYDITVSVKHLKLKTVFVYHCSFLMEV